MAGAPGWRGGGSTARVIAFDCRLARPGFTLDAAFTAGPGLTALFGPSGSGKSTVIRLLAGLERPDAGRIEVGGETLLDTGRCLAVPPHRRRFGVVFQEALLFPHLSVAANLAYGRRFAGGDAPRVSPEAVTEMLGIGHLLGRRPDTLSGGERQRVAFGRALLMAPRLLLMDEPLSSLDAARRMEILPFIERLRDAFAIPILYVSHAVEEVARLAARVVRLEAGRVVAEGTPAETLAPAGAPLAAGRFDAVSLLMAGPAAFLPDFAVSRLAHPAGTIVVPGDLGKSARVTVAVRATDVTLSAGPPGAVSLRTSLAGRIVGIATDDGPFALVRLALEGGDTLAACLTRLAVAELGLAEGQDVQALVKAVAIDERGVRLGR
jgi:molybdate transport system ATP-binding protein